MVGEGQAKRYVASLVKLKVELSRNMLGIAVPVIPGIMPLQTYSSFLRLTKLCGTHIPPEIQAELEPIKVSISSVLSLCS